MKKILTTLLLALVAIAVNAFEQGDFEYYILTDSTVRLEGFKSSYTGSPTTLTIPGYTFNASTQKYYRVTHIGTSAFYNKTTLTQVEIRPGVETILSYAFNKCTSLKTVYLPSSIKSIGDYVFYQDPITVINCAAETMPTISSNAFYQMGTVSGSRYWNCATPDGKTAADAVTLICNNFTRGWTHTAADFHNHVIGNSNEGTLCDVYMNVVTPIKASNPYAYYGKVKLLGATPRSSNTSKTLKFGYNESFSMNADYYYVTAIDKSFHYRATDLKVLDLSQTSKMEEIEDNALNGCTALTTANITATKVGNYAFYNCTSLSSVTLSERVQTLGTLSFANTAVSTVNIPASLSSYGNGAFAMCPNLTAFSVSSSNNYFSTSSFQYVTALYNKDSSNRTLLQFPAGASYVGFVSGLKLKAINPYAFAGVQRAIEIPYGVTSIGAYAFYNAKCTSILIPSSVTSFHSTTFSAMKTNHLYFNKTTIPSTLTYSYSFSSVTNTSGGTSIQLSVPYGCANKYATTSPWSSTFTTINEKAYDALLYNSNGESLGFYVTVTSNSTYTDPKVSSTATYSGQCKIVKGTMGTKTGYLNLPIYWSERNTDKVYLITEVEREVFRDQTGITKVQGGTGIKKIGALSFAGLTGCTQGFDIPYPVEFGDSSLFNCWTPTITLGDRLERIGNDAFRQSAVRQVIMPPSVTSIGSRIVAGVHQLDSIKLSPNITEIPNCGLGWCSARWIVIPYGVKKIGSQAFFSDEYGAGLDEPVRENVVVIPSSVTTIASDAFALARHLDAIFLNVNYGVFTSTKSDWLRRLAPSATNDYDWSGHKLYVPAGQLEQYRNDSGIKQCWSRGDIQCGAFDFTTGNDFWSTMYRMTVVDATNKKAKYVYNWGTGSTSITVANTKTDHNSGITYTMVEIGDSCWVNRPAVTTVSFPSTSNITKIGPYAFKDCTGLTGEISVPATVSEIGQYSFWNCNKLTSLFLNRTSTTTIADYAWNSYDDYTYDRIKLYMPLSQYWNLYGQTKDWLPTGFTYNYLLPYIKPTTEWSVVSVPTEDAVGLPASGDFYIATTYNSTTQAIGKEKLENNMGIKGFEGMLFKGTVGTVYRFRQTNEINSSTPYNVAYYNPSVNYLDGVHPTSYSYNYQTVSDNSTYDNYYFVPTDNDFAKITSSKTMYAGEAYLHLTDAMTGGATTVYTTDVATYDLWIAGVQVSERNCYDLTVIDGVSGTSISYSPSMNVLTVKNATINPSSDAPGIRSSIPGLKINFIGTSSIKSKGSYPAVSIESYATMYGTGTATFLSAANIGLRVSNSNTTLTIKDGVQLSAGGQTYGVRGTNSGKIYITGENTKLTALGMTASYSACVTTLGTGLAITEPAGAKFNSSGTVVSSTGSTIAGTNVVISKQTATVTRGDVNGDGSVNISDVTTLIDYLLSGNASGINLSAADCNQDNAVNISDVTGLIDFLLSGHW